jgi:hypothetical protein
MPFDFEQKKPAGQRSRPDAEAGGEGDGLHRAVQMRRMQRRTDQAQVSKPGDAAEKEADVVADAAVSGSGEQVKPTAQVAAPMVQRKAAADPLAGDKRNPKDPKQFATYEEWLHAFSNLKESFSSVDTPAGNEDTVDDNGLMQIHGTGQTVLGEKATPDKPAAPADKAGPMKSGEEYVDHVSDKWILDNLPDELRMAVYQLPTDCADVAVMLRHVWLFAHGRTEKFGDWTLGVGAGKDKAERAKNLDHLAAEEVFSGSVGRIVAPYTDEGGGQLLTFEKLQHVLHPGDVLVWEHHDGPSGKKRTGGHTQTVENITRNESGEITSIKALQGNQPVTKNEAADIQADEKKQGKKVDDEKHLRDMPGRRIEVGELRGKDEDDLPGDPPRLDKDGRWSWGDAENTFLLSAGPASGAPRPKPQKEKGEKKALRKVTDWVPSLKAAPSGGLQGVFEAALEEARAGLEGGIESVTADQMVALGQAAGARLHKLRADGGAVDELKSDMLAELKALGAAANGEQAAKVVELFAKVEESLKSADPEVK